MVQLKNSGHALMLQMFKCSRRWVKASEHWMVCEAFPPAKRAAPDPTSASQCAFHGLSKTANYHGPRAFHSAKPQMLRPQIQRLGNCNSQDTPPPQGQLQHSVEAIWDKLGIPRIEIWAGICSVPEAIYLWGRGKWLQKVLKNFVITKTLELLYIQVLVYTGNVFIHRKSLLVGWNTYIIF